MWVAGVLWLHKSYRRVWMRDGTRKGFERTRVWEEVGRGRLCKGDWCQACVVWAINSQGPCVKCRLIQLLVPNARGLKFYSAQKEITQILLKKMSFSGLMLCNKARRLTKRALRKLVWLVSPQASSLTARKAHSMLWFYGCGCLGKPANF